MSIKELILTTFFTRRRSRFYLQWT